MIFGTCTKENTLIILETNIMLTIEDLKQYENIHYDLEKYCYTYFMGHSNYMQNYNFFELAESGNIAIHYYTNEGDKTFKGVIKVSYEELFNYINTLV